MGIIMGKVKEKWQENKKDQREPVCHYVEGPVKTWVHNVSGEERVSVNNPSDLYWSEKLTEESVMKANNPIDPNHYKKGGIECIDYLEAKMSKEELKGFCKGNILKYISRLGEKDDPVKELGKSKWYINKLLELYKD